MQAPTKEDFDRALATVVAACEDPQPFRRDILQKLTNGIRARTLFRGTESMLAEVPTLSLCLIIVTMDLSARAQRKVAKLLLQSSAESCKVLCLSTSGETMAADLLSRPQHVVRVLGSTSPTDAQAIWDLVGNQS